MKRYDYHHEKIKMFAGIPANSFIVRPEAVFFTSLFVRHDVVIHKDIVAFMYAQRKNNGGDRGKNEPRDEI
jgi:hypothetical protein